MDCQEVCATNKSPPINSYPPTSRSCAITYSAPDWAGHSQRQAFLLANYEGGRGIRSGNLGSARYPRCKCEMGISLNWFPARGASRTRSTSPQRGPQPLSQSSQMSRFLSPPPLKVLALVPLPTNGNLVNNFQGPVRPSGITTDELTSRFDYRILIATPSHGRYIQISMAPLREPVSSLRAGEQRSGVQTQPAQSKCEPLGNA